MNYNNKKFCVYKHTCPSGKYYIGITSQQVEKRWGNNGIKYFNKRKDGEYCQRLFVRAIQKYGWDNISHEILYDNLDSYQAKIIEISLIREAKKNNLSYNIAGGGDGIIGVSHESWLKGKKMPEWIKQKLRNKKRSEEYKRNLSLIKIGTRGTRCKKVNIYTLDGIYLDTFECCADVDRYLNIKIGKTSAVCTHIQKTVGGLQARFVGDNTPLLNIDYKSGTESVSVEVIDTLNGYTYNFKTIQAASRYTKIPLYKLLYLAHNKVKITKDGIMCNFTCDYKNVKLFNRYNNKSNNAG